MTILYSNDLETALNAGISGNTPTLSTDFALSGTKSMKSIVDYNDSNNAYRCEITSLSLGGGSSLMASGQTYWLGFALYVPATYPYSTQGDIFYQIHSTPDAGEAYLNPPLSLQIEKDQWKWTMLSDNNVITSKGSYAISSSEYMGTVTKGAWTRFVVQFKIGSADSAAFIRVWVNDVQKVDYTGRTFFNDTSGPYNKFGIYRPAWKPGNESWGVIPSELAVFTSRTLYHDDIKIGDGSAVYADVAPSGSGGAISGTVINSVNTDNQVYKNIAVNTAYGSGHSGVFGAAISDSDTTVTLSGLGFPDGLSSVFHTDSLTDISTPATLTLDYAVPAKYDTNPRVWDDNFSSQGTFSNYTTTVGPFSSGSTLTTATTGANWIRSNFNTGVSVAINDVVDVWFFTTAGTSGNGLFGTVIGAAGTENTKMDYYGSLGGTMTLLASTGGTPGSCTCTASTIYPSMYITKLRYTAGAAGNLWVGIGPRTSNSGESINQLGVIVWKNRDANDYTSTLTITLPELLPAANSAPTISTVSEVTPGQAVTITGTNLRNVESAYLTDGVTDSYLTEFVASSDGTSATGIAPLSTALATDTIKLNWYPYLEFNNTPRTWDDNAGGVLVNEDYATSTWLTSAGSTLRSIGSNWHRTSSTSITALQGEVVNLEFYYILGSSNKYSISIRNSVAATNIIVEYVNGVAEINTLGFGNNASVSISTTNEVSKCSVTFTNTVTSELLVGIGPFSSIETESVIALGYKLWSGTTPSVVSGAATMSSTPVAAKTIRWSAALGNRVYAYNAGTTSLFNGTVSVLITDGDLYTDWATAFANKLAYVDSLTFTAGEAYFREADLTSGSIDSLLTGSQGYNFWLKTSDNSYRADGLIEIQEE